MLDHYQYGYHPAVSPSEKRFEEIQNHSVPFVISDDDPELQIVRAQLVEWRERGRPSRH